MLNMYSSCAGCKAPLEPEDGHTECPSCLGIEHLRQGLTEQACMNCTCLSVAVRTARLAQVDQQLGTSQGKGRQEAAPAGRPIKRQSGATHTAPKGKKQKGGLALKVDKMAVEFEQIKALLTNLQPPAPSVQGSSVLAETPPAGQAELPPPSLSSSGKTQDELSIRASESLELDEPEPHNSHSHGSQTGSQVTSQSTTGASEAGRPSVQPALKAALARLGLDAAPAAVPKQNAFFRGSTQPSTWVVPTSAPYIEELQRCWADPRRLSHLPRDCRVLAAMQDAPVYGLQNMPNIEPPVAALVLSPNEALRPDARCPRAQCRVTDDLIVRSYDTAARMGRIGNSMSHLMLALTETLQGTDQTSSQELGDASLQALAYMTRELGRLMSYLTLARRQIWLAQSPLAEPDRRVLRSLPVLPGELFGQAAQQALDRSSQVVQARQQFASLRRGSQPRHRAPTSRGPAPALASWPVTRQESRRTEGFRRPTTSRTRGYAQDNRAEARRPSRDQRGRTGRR